MGSPPDLFVVWRLSNHVDLSGHGGLIVSGRWHTRPRPILYCADEPHTAYCEALKHFGADYLMPDAYKLLKITAPKRAQVERLDEDRLPGEWFEDSVVALSACRAIGDEWLGSGRTVLMRVPSAARRGAFNYLVNPGHRDADDFAVVEVTGRPLPDWVKRPSLMP